MTFISVILLSHLGAIQEASAQTGRKDIVFRSGFTFNRYTDRYDAWYYAHPDPVEKNTINFEKSSYYFTPGVGKFLGKGYYLGVQAVIGQISLDQTERNENHETILFADTQLDRVGGGLLFRKYFSLSNRLSPFVGVSSNFYKEKGITNTQSGESISRKSNYIATEIHVGANFMIVPRLEIEVYYSPGMFFGEKNMYYDNSYDFRGDLGKQGQEFSVGINYHLIRN